VHRERNRALAVRDGQRRAAGFRRHSIASPLRSRRMILMWFFARTPPGLRRNERWCSSRPEACSTLPVRPGQLVLRSLPRQNSKTSRSSLKDLSRPARLGRSRARSTRRCLHWRSLGGFCRCGEHIRTESVPRQERLPGGRSLISSWSCALGGRKIGLLRARGQSLRIGFRSMRTKKSR
jgi:hypothetical protein